MISSELESFDGVEDVHLAVEVHLFADDPTGAEQSALVGAVDTVHYNRCFAGGAAFQTTVLNHLDQAQESSGRPRRLSQRAHMSSLKSSKRNLTASGARTNLKVEAQNFW